MIRVQVTIEVPETEIRRVEAVVSARLPREWQYVNHRRITRRSQPAAEARQQPEGPPPPAPVQDDDISPIQPEQNIAQVDDLFVDSILGGLEAYPQCQHCLMGPCITVSEITRIQGSCAPHITNHSKRHKNYRRFWKSLKDRGLWQHETYLDRKTLAGIGDVELRELMPQCVLDDTRKRYPNPPGVPYMGHKRA